MLPERLQSAEGPAEALADELPGCFRRFGPGDGLFIVGDAPTETADGDGQVGVLGNRVRGDAARGIDGLFAPGTERAGHNGDAIQEVEGALLHVLAGDVFERLPAREPARTVADLHVAGDGANLGIGEMANEFADRVRFDFGVGVDGHDNFGVRQGQGLIQRRRLAAIYLMNDADARLMRTMAGIKIIPMKKRNHWYNVKINPSARASNRSSAERGSITCARVIPIRSETETN